jgi:hypothetical protein
MVMLTTHLTLTMSKKVTLVRFTDAQSLSRTCPISTRIRPWEVSVGTHLRWLLLSLLSTLLVKPPLRVLITLELFLGITNVKILSMVQLKMLVSKVSTTEEVSKVELTSTKTTPAGILFHATTYSSGF